MGISVLQNSMNNGSLLLYHDYRQGHFNDLSGKRNNGTWSGTDGGFCKVGKHFPGISSMVTVADNIELRLTVGTIVVFGEIKTYPSTALTRIISKRDAGGFNFEWRYSPAVPQLEFFDNVNNRTLAGSILGRSSLGISFASGATPVGYANGISLGNYSGVTAPVADDAPLILGNIYLASNSIENIIGGFVIFNRQLDATEHAVLVKELNVNGGVGG